MTDLLAVRDLRVEFPIRSPILRRRVGSIHAVRGVTLSVSEGETLAVVGESGSGKSTLARAVCRIAPVAGGEIEFEGADVLALRGTDLHAVRARLQMVFQDPLASLNRRWRIGEIISEPLAAHGRGTSRDRRLEAERLLQRVGIDPTLVNRRPSALSGGQRQRIGIARAIALRPRMIICDEAISALDVSVQAQILNLLTDLRREMGLAYLFITHDLGVVRRFADRVAVMHAGLVVETAPTKALFAEPLHPYSGALLAAAPRLSVDKTLIGERVRGTAPSPLSEPRGCLFAGRCAHVQAICRDVAPPMLALPGKREVACHLVQVEPPRSVSKATSMMTIAEGPGT